MIQTVLGKIPAESLGVTLIHEHFFCGSAEMQRALGDRWCNRAELVEKSVRDLAFAKEKYGLCTVVDGSPANLGRDASLLREISEKSGVNIVASCGAYFHESPTFRAWDPAELAAFFIDECQSGIDGTDALPGILKCATGFPGFTEINEILLEAIGIVQHRTGLPMFAHNEHHKKTAIRQLEIFHRAGVDMSRLIIGHCSDTQDIGYLEAILREGCYLGFDRLHPSDAQADTVCELMHRGWTERILLSRDSCQFIDFNGRTWEKLKNDPSKYPIVLEQFPAMLKSRGVSDAELLTLLCGNPARVLDL